MYFRLLLIIGIEILAICFWSFSADEQTGMKESSKSQYVLLERRIQPEDTLHLDVLIDSTNIDKKHLEENFKELAKDADNFKTIYILVWDDRQAWEKIKNDRAIDFSLTLLSPEEYHEAEKHCRASYVKRNSPPNLESFSFHPFPGSKSIGVNLIVGKEETPKEEKLNDSKKNYAITSIIYRQVASELYLSLEPGARSEDALVRIACDTILEYSELSTINFFDNEAAAKSAPAFYRLPERERSKEQYEFILSHLIAWYARIEVKEDIFHGFLQYPGKAYRKEVNEGDCKLPLIQR
jgi:hypothetical protein